MNAIDVPSAPRRRAFTVFEMALAVILLGVAMTVTVQMLGWIADGRLAAERRRAAVREAAILMENLSAKSWETLTAESVKAPKLSPESKRALRDAELSVVVDDKGAGADAKRISVRVRWRNRAGEWDAPVRLTTWVHRRKGASQ